MSDFVKHINDVTTGEITVEQMTDAEIDAREAEIAQAVVAKATKVAEAQDKAIAKAALLDRLGITADEAKLLLN